MEQVLSERQIEDVFERFHHDLIEPNLKLVSRQYIFKNGRRADLIFSDQNNRKLIVELKRNIVNRADIGQLLEYFGLMDEEKPRIALIAPIIPKSIKKAFEHFGIEYLEFDISKIQKLFNSIDFSESNNSLTTGYIQEIISKPLSQKKLVDGNIAFKVTYVDRDWSNVCTSNNADYNFKHRTWCKIQKDFEINCQSDYWKNNPPDGNNHPCIDCISKKELLFYPGHNHGSKKNNEPRRMLNGKRGKIMLLTSRRPDQTEEQRFVFGVAEIEDFVLAGATPDYEIALGSTTNYIDFSEYGAPLFWNFYNNPNAPTRKAWNTGLFRYMDDGMIYSLLKHVKLNFKLDDKQKTIIENLIAKVE